MDRLRRRVHGASVVVALGLVASLLMAWSDPAGAVTVTDETTLRAAWSNPAETRIDLAADITLTCDVGGTGQRTSTIPLTLDGHGHSITVKCANSLALVVPDDALGGGASPVTLRNVTVKRGNATVPATLTNSSISGNPSSTAGEMSQSMTVQVRKARHHQPRRHRSRPAPAAPAPVEPVQAVVRFTG
jgi:Putative pectate lyase-like adhesive domain